MGSVTKIEWCDYTFNPWTGCTKVSEACRYCYAAEINRRFNKGENWGKGAPRKLASSSTWALPYRWARKQRGRFSLDHRPRVFCASMADWLDDEVPWEYRYHLLKTIYVNQELDWLLLSKRPEKWHGLIDEILSKERGNCDLDDLDRWLVDWIGGKQPQNVWVGTTVESQADALTRIPELLKIPAEIRFLSCEPLLDEVNLWPFLEQNPGAIDWVIAGGESGSKARPSNPDWFRHIRDDCGLCDIPFFFKQWGEWAPDAFKSPDKFLKFDSKTKTFRMGKKKAGRLLDGVLYHNFPTTSLSSK